MALAGTWYGPSLGPFGGHGMPAARTPPSGQHSRTTWYQKRGWDSQGQSHRDVHGLRRHARVACSPLLNGPAEGEKHGHRPQPNFPPGTALHELAQRRGGVPELHSTAQDEQWRLRR